MRHNEINEELPVGQSMEGFPLPVFLECSRDAFNASPPYFTITNIFDQENGINGVLNDADNVN
jgi:hypothetical protein